MMSHYRCLCIGPRQYFICLYEHTMYKIPPFLARPMIKIPPQYLPWKKILLPKFVIPPLKGKWFYFTTFSILLSFHNFALLLSGSVYFLKSTTILIHHYFLYATPLSYLLLPFLCYHPFTLLLPFHCFLVLVN